MVDSARAPGAYIDEPNRNDDEIIDYLNDSDPEEDSSSDLEDYLCVDDEDWEIAERDFTKHYNRLKQHLAVRSGTASSSSSSINKATHTAPLPPVNSPALNSTKTKSPVVHVKDKATDQLTALSKFTSRISKIDVPYALRGGFGVNPKGPSAHANIKDKSDRATNEQVLDPRTRLILFKMIGRGQLEEINGCVSTGKEANVYHALAGANFSWPSKPFSQESSTEGIPSKPVHLAIKIYKTSILIFKDRTRYVEGEHRFRRGANTSNPRKMVRLWAEKELRNLKRIAAAGIPCPTPVEVRENVLLMEFVGDSQGWASPRLKDASLPEAPEQLTALYIQLVLMVRRMYQQCKLVHADLSEYNILYHDPESRSSSTEGPDEKPPSSPPSLVIIDVSQSVEASHPHAWDFLRKDIKNVDDFWSKHGISTLGLRHTFDFVTHDNIHTESLKDDEAVLHAWIQDPSSRLTKDVTPLSEIQEEDTTDQKHEDAVFLQSHLPRSFAEMKDPEHFIERQKLKASLVGERGDSTPKLSEAEESGDETEEDDQEDVDEEDNSGEEDSASDSGTKFDVNTPRGHRHEDRQTKKERKQGVKAQNKERRKTKVPKAEKKKIIKKTKSGK